MRDSSFFGIPVNSVVLLPAEQRLPFIEQALQLPPTVKELAFSARASAFLKGLLRVYNLPETATPDLSFLILSILIGQKQRQELPALIQEKFKVSPEVAAKMSGEIEKDLFAPISLDLNDYLARKRTAAPARFGAPKPATPPMSKPVAAQQGIRNVVDLKQQTTRPPVAPPIPRSTPLPRPIPQPQAITPPRPPIAPPRPPAQTTGPLPRPQAPTPPTAFTHPIQPRPANKPVTFDPKALQKKSNLWEDKKK